MQNPDGAAAVAAAQCQQQDQALAATAAQRDTTRAWSFYGRQCYASPSRQCVIPDISTH